MFVQDIFVSFYDYRPFRNGLINKIVGNSTKITGFVGKRLLPLWFQLFPGKVNNDRSDVVACMTSFPVRIPYIWIVLESLLRQRLQPRKVLLYLSELQFDSIEQVEYSLKKYTDMGFLRIIWVKEDYRSYKKFWYYLKEYPESPFITLDDDIIYKSDTILSLVSEANKGKKNIPACYCYHIRRNSDGSLKSYSAWDKQTRNGDSGIDIFFGSGGGTYFPVGSLKGALMSYELIMSICPLADDIWLNAFVRKNGYVVKCVKNRRSVVCVLNRHNTTLSHENLGRNKNDEQLKNVIHLFKKEYNIIPF